MALLIGSNRFRPAKRENLLRGYASVVTVQLKFQSGVELKNVQVWLTPSLAALTVDPADSRMLASDVPSPHHRAIIGYSAIPTKSWSDFSQWHF